MVYDWTSDIEFLTRETGLPTAVVDWAVEYAKIFYMAGDSTGYDEDLSSVDNQLVAILASAFVVLYIDSLDMPDEFSLDELSFKQSSNKSVSKAINDLNRYFSMFFQWKNLYESRGSDLQFVDTGTILDATTFTPFDVIATLQLPDGVDQ